MTEDEAKARAEQIAGTTGYHRLTELCALVLAENDHQNLIARSTIDEIWCRHIVDSIQLIDLVDADDGPWLDIGTGGGFPGLAIAAIVKRQVILAEPRRRRAAFLSDAASRLGLTNVLVEPVRVESLTIAAATISARAVAPPQKLLQAARHCATASTQWVFPRGRLGDGELAGLAENHPDLTFHVKQSISDASASIIVARPEPAGG